MQSEMPVHRFQLSVLALMCVIHYNVVLAIGAVHIYFYFFYFIDYAH